MLWVTTGLFCTRIFKMLILYSVIARGTTILTSYAICPGNFGEVTEHILEKIALEDGKKTLSHSNFLLHYICENKIVYMCITDDEFERSRAFLYLCVIQRIFSASFGDRAQTAIAYAMNNEFSPVLRRGIEFFIGAKDLDTLSRLNWNSSELDELKDIMKQDMASFGDRAQTANGYAMNNEFYPEDLTLLRSEIEFYTAATALDTLSRLNRNSGELDELKDIMKQGQDVIISRGENLSLLCEKSENQYVPYSRFRTTSRNPQRSLFWKIFKIYVIIAGVCVVLVYLVLSMFCGGLTLKNC